MTSTASQKGRVYPERLKEQEQLLRHVQAVHWKFKFSCPNGCSKAFTRHFAMGRHITKGRCPNEPQDTTACESYLIA